MGFNFPAGPADGDSYEMNGVTFSYDATDAVWRRASAKTGFVLKAGDTMSGVLNLIDPDPVTPLSATHKKYVDRIIAEQSLWQGVWQVAANTPDLDPAVMLPLAGYSWTCQTANPNIPEIAPAALPGIGGLTIAAGDTVKWNEVNAVYDLIRAAIGIARMIISDTPPAVALHGQQWWNSSNGKMYTRYDDGTSQQWTQVSGGGGGSAISSIVPVSDTSPVNPVEGLLWFDSSVAALFIYYGGQWVEVGPP